MSTEVQSIIFDKSMYSVTEAKKWLRDNSFVAPKVDKTDRYLRFRQKQPSYFDESSFRTIPFGKNTGIKAIIGVPMKHNPFYQESDTPTGDGHRIGAYAMLFTKAKNKYLLAVSMGAGDSAEAQMELAKAKQYWDLYQMARKDYPTIEERKGSDILLHEYTSFAKAIKSELPKRNNPMKTHKNPVIDGKVLVANMKGIRKIVSDIIKDGDYEGLAKDIHTQILSVLSKLNNLGVKAKVEEFFFWDRDANVGYTLQVYSSSMGVIVVSMFGHEDDPDFIDANVVYVNHDSNADIFEYLQNEYGYEMSKQDKKYGSTRDYNISNKNTFKAIADYLYSNLIKDKDLQKSAYAVDVWNNSLQNVVRKNPHCHCVGNRRNPHCAVHGSKNPYGTAMVQGSMGGLAYRYNPTKKIMDFDSFMDHLEDGNVFVGRYVVFVQNGVPMRLEIGSSTPKEVSPEVAFYADLAGQAELVGTSDIDTFSDDYRLLIRQASDAARGGFVAGGGVPVIEVEEIVVPTPALTDPALEALEELETIFKYAQDLKIQNATELERASDNLKYYLREALKVGKRSEKKVISRLQILADSKRAKNPETLTEKIIARYIKFAEKSIGAKIDIVDDETGKKTTPKKEAEKIVEEIQADPNYRPQFDMQKHLVRGGIFQTPKVMKAPFDIEEEEEIVAPAPVEEDAFMKMLREMQAKDEAFKAQFKNNPRGSHYAYRMSTLDHDHRMNRTALNNVFIKKNPSDTFRFPQVTIDGVMIDNDIYTWLSSALSDWSQLIAVAETNPKYKAAISILNNMKKSNEDFIIRMQTDIVPAVESRVKKALATGKTLKDILGEEKKNPYRRNTKRQRRYY